MGVHDLWPILDPTGYEVPLTNLSGKKVAVDLGGWVVQSKLCKGLNTSWKPYLKNLFYRVSFLLKNGVLPVFVAEGKAPELKKNAILERNLAANGKRSKKAESSEGISSRNKFDQILSECQDMLKSLGVPCLKSSGEAEAYCAYLNSKGLVDGCISNDNDSFLYGAEVVFRDFTIDSKDPRVKKYDMKDIRNKLQLDRKKLVALALLLGCDYVKGVPGIGRESALKFMEEHKNADVLERFKQWKGVPESELFPSYNFALDVKSVSHCENCGHPGTSLKHQKIGCDICRSANCCYLKKDDDVCPCPWHQNMRIKISIKNELKIYQAVKKMDEFPDLKVIAEYLDYLDDIPAKEHLEWAEPNLLSFQVGVDDWLHWTVAEALQKMLPIITAWQIAQLCQTSSTSDSNFLLNPFRIVQPRKKKGEAFYEVKWTSSNVQHKNVDLCTWEKTDTFSKAYPDVTEKFLQAVESKKEKKKKKSSRKTKRAPKTKSNDVENHCSDSSDTTQNHKISEYFLPSPVATDSQSDVEGVSHQDTPTSPTRKRAAEEILHDDSAKLLCLTDKAHCVIQNI